MPELHNTDITELMAWLESQRDLYRACASEAQQNHYPFVFAQYDGIVNAYTQIICHIKGE